MKLKATQIALAAIALCSAASAAAQTTTIQAESMTRSNYALDGSLIKVSSYSSPGTATKTFSGASGTYNVQVFVQLENDGRPTLEVYKGSTLLRNYTYPLGSSLTSFTINNVALASGETIRLVGRAQAGAVARVDRIVLTQVSAAPTPPTTPPTTPPAPGGTITMEAEGMTRTNYSLEGSLIRVASTGTPGTATKTFSGASATYNIQVLVQLENDGQPTLEVYKGSTLLRKYTYPLGSSLTNFAINGVALASGDTIRLVGRAQAGAVARVDKLLFTQVAATTPPPTTPPPSTPPPTTPPPTTTPPPVTTTPPPATTLPSTNTRAVATFESLGLYWTPPSNPGAAGCKVQYRKAGESAWKDGLAMWYDSRNSECRGSLVYLTPGTDYQVQFSLPGQQPSAQLATRTWSEQFPIARTVTLQSGSQQVNITEGGSPSGYVLYTGPAGTTLDVANASVNNITIAAPYVIVRGLVLKGAQKDAVRLLNGAHDVVIEDNDISGWGSYARTNSDGQKVGVNYEAGIRAQRLTGLERIIIQRNKIHHPRYGTNSWTFGHPEGPQGIGFQESAGGNHVFRHNEIYSSEGQYFNDGIGEGENFSSVGFPHADSDIYGNLISHCWDDAIEAEGGNRNVRIWGNYMDRTMVGVATTATHVGPVYIFRNVHNRSRYLSSVPVEQDNGGPFGKTGTNGSWGNGRRYVFHNTMLQATAAGAGNTLGGNGGLIGPAVPMTNTVSRNNVWHIKKTWWPAINALGGSGNDLDFDLFNGNITAYAGAEPNGLVGTPIYASGHGWQSESNGYYQLAPNSPGYDRGARLPNFNDSYTGAAPDMGAAEAGRPPMRFGLRAAGIAGSSSDGAATTSPAAQTSASAAPGGSGGLCSTLACAFQ